MLQRSARLQYLLLALVAFFAFTHLYLGVRHNVALQIHGRSLPRQPFFGIFRGEIVSTALEEAKAAGLKAGDKILSVNGLPYTSQAVLLEQLRSSRPGDTLKVTFSRPGEANPLFAMIRLVAVNPQRAPVWAWVVL